MSKAIVAALLLVATGCASSSGSAPWIELVSRTDFGLQLHVRLDRSGQGQFRTDDRDGWSGIQLDADDLASIERILKLERFETLGPFGKVWDAGYKSIAVRKGDRVTKVLVEGADGDNYQNPDARHFARIWNVLLTVTAPQEDLAWRECAE